MAPHPSRLHGRFCILLATILWSLNGVFIPLLTTETRLGVQEPPIHPWQIAFYRVFFAAMVLLPGIRRSEMRFRPWLILSALSFAAMNVMFIYAITKGDVASAMFLQYTAPAWLYVACVYILGEAPDRRSLISVLIALIGISVIVVGGWKGGQILIIALGLGSGITYAGVLLGIRMMRDQSSRWVTVVNLLAGAAVLTPVLFAYSMPSWKQLATLLVFGGLQLGFPYFLMARGLRSVSPQEAGTLTLIEPILSTLWAYVVGNQVPARETLIGGTFILTALLFRYWPFPRSEPAVETGALPP